MQNKKIEQNIKILLNLFNTSNFDQVIAKGKKIIKDFPEYVVLYNIIGSAYQNKGDFELAKNLFIKANKMDPNNIAVMNNLATAYKNLGKFELSEDLFTRVIKKKPNYINAYINFGNLKRDVNNFNEAIELYKKALLIDDKIPVIYYSLALAFQGLGNFEEAIRHAKKVLLLDPKFTQADVLISQSTKYSLENEHFIEMNKKINNLELIADQKINIHFALAKAYEDMDNIELSFDHLKKGNKIKRNSILFNIQNEIQLFKQIKNTYTQIKHTNLIEENYSNKKMIFILGMPRSGTTLVEQIISSHSSVFGAGELPYISRIVQEELMNDNQLSLNKLKDLVENKNVLKTLRDKYYYFIEKFNCEENFITDKAPLNFRWIGLIQILFPNSKIIHCIRDPRDNCLSLYKNLFEGGLNFSYDEKELGTYYNLYVDIMNFWKKLMPNLIFDAKYESIIENQEEQSKKIINFCGLKWEDQCLEFYKNKSPIKTMSTAQARKPIYKNSLSSYKKFSPYLVNLNSIIKN